VLVLGLALRVLAIVSWWPVTPTLEDGYQRFAALNPFLDPQHPAGYDLIVAGWGALTRQIAFTVLIQHLTGFASGLLLYAATRRLTGSRWAGLLPMAIVLLAPDEVFLEHSIMSESWAILALALGLYAAVRAGDDPERWWRWPLATGVAAGGGGDDPHGVAADRRGGRARPGAVVSAAAGAPARASARCGGDDRGGGGSAAGLRRGQRRLWTALWHRPVARLVPVRPRSAVRRLPGLHPASADRLAVSDGGAGSPPHGLLLHL